MSGRRRRQGGSVIVLFAAMSLVLIAFVGLVVDGGEITSQGRAGQNAADGAVLAAAYELINHGYSLTTATSLAQTVAVKNGASSSDLTMTYLDSTGSVTATPALVRTVKADVTHVFPTLFLPIINIDSASISAHAEATISVAPGACAVCVLDATANPALNISAVTTVDGGPIRVNSAGAAAFTATADVTVSNPNSTPAIGVVGGVSTSHGSVSPSPVTPSSPISDPLILVSPPSVTGTSTDYSASGNTTITPGIYSEIAVTGGGTTTMAPGIYVLTGRLYIRGGHNLNANNVMIYLACSGYPTPCTSGQSGGYVDVGGTGAINITGPSYGTYQGLSIFSDRNNVGQISFQGSGSLYTVGTVYGASAPISLGGGGTISVSSRLIGDAVSISSAATLAFTQSQNYQAPNMLTLSV